ncbi:MAG: ATP cone domain-containing protein [Candidatus Nanoarchaeia archaeon]|nr:ATP cone domain-containing protein [Candidatus Nanoarchaeia archaeon]
MVTKVIKKNKSIQPYSESKIVKACIDAKMPTPISETIAKMVTSELKSKDSVKSSDIRKIVLGILTGLGKSMKIRKAYKKKKK